jgi:hypothetical protein
MDEQKTKKLNCNRILLESVFMRRFYYPDGILKAAYVDGSSLPFLIEEFVSLAVTEVAIVKNFPASDFIDHLPQGLKNRVVLVKEQQAFSKLQALFAPIAEEFELVLSYGIQYLKPLPRDLSDSIGTLYFSLHTYLIALEHELQIDINLRAVKNAIAALRQSSRNPQARSNLAILSGIFETYDYKQLDSVELHSSAPERLISIFQEFVEDETYRNMSTHAHSLGFPIYARRSMTVLKRLAKKLVSKAPFKDIVNLSSRGISTATSLPIPDSDMYASMIKKGYLPPIVPLDEAIKRAKKSWESINPDYVPHPLFKPTPR